MTTRETARPLQRLWIARGRAASLPSTYTTSRDATLTVTDDGFQVLERLETFDGSKPDWIGRYRYRRDATKVLKEVAYID
jgi:hypothetical protein